jgi:hypothetical protein
VSAPLGIGDIYDAIFALEREANFRRNIGGNGNYERARDLDVIRQRASAQYRPLQDAMPRFRSLSAEADRSYDRYVTRDREPDAEGCSCHINPPCGYCTRETEEDEA